MQIFHNSALVDWMQVLLYHSLPRADNQGAYDPEQKFLNSDSQIHQLLQINMLLVGLMSLQFYCHNFLVEFTYTSTKFGTQKCENKGRVGVRAKKKNPSQNYIFEPVTVIS